MIWTLVDAVSAYALVETWRARSGAGKGKKDALLAALYVSDLSMNVEKLTRLLSACQLLVQPIPVPPVAGVLYFVDIKHVASAEHYVRRAWSVNIHPGAGLLKANIANRLGKASPALFCLAALVHVSLSSILLVFPVAMLLLGQPRSGLAHPKPISIDPKKGVILGLGFLAHFVLLSLTSTLISGGLQWIWQTWFVECVRCFAFDRSVDSCSPSDRLSLPDLTPNPGLWWYFFTEMFDHFRPFFLMAFSVLRHPTREERSLMSS